MASKSAKQTTKDIASKEEAHVSLDKHNCGTQSCFIVHSHLELNKSRKVFNLVDDYT